MSSDVVSSRAAVAEHRLRGALQEHISALVKTKDLRCSAVDARVMRDAAKSSVAFIARHHIAIPFSQCTTEEDSDEESSGESAESTSSNAGGNENRNSGGAASASTAQAGEGESNVPAKAPKSPASCPSARFEAVHYRAVQCTVAGASFALRVRHDDCQGQLAITCGPGAGQHWATGVSDLKASLDPQAAVDVRCALPPHDPSHEALLQRVTLWPSIAPGPPDDPAAEREFNAAAAKSALSRHSADCPLTELPNRCLEAFIGACLVHAPDDMCFLTVPPVCVDHLIT